MVREKVILQDFKVLLICTSRKWSTIERRILFDCIFLRGIGCNPVVFCLQNSQLDRECEKEDIQRVYISKIRFNLSFDIVFFRELSKHIKQNDYDIIHCYSLMATWMSAFLLKRHPQTPLLFTLNQNVNSIYHNYIARWLLKRVDYIFTLSDEIQEFVGETFDIQSYKIKNLGGGIELNLRELDREVPQKIGCVINNMAELARLRYVVKVFRVLKSHNTEKYQDLSMSLFLGPRVYQKDRAKKVLKELDYEFYEGDIFLYQLENKMDEFRAIDLLIGLAFDEPLNDFEIISLINGRPVLFPRTAMRQSLLFKYRWVGESYFENDIREARTKLTKILDNYPIYRNALKDYSDEIIKIHGLDTYADTFQFCYENAYSKRHRKPSEKSPSS
ncbi:MAG: hypothetical protein CME65_03890 [Halobacteriovoraceae bacterium]|nr:hypothetical protein [Halobacteriovoraceae bacterium]|tara:strand:- start:1921 stop:3084 length:1164 start_codon:yes stop_codon:yes gene_type:complete